MTKKMRFRCFFCTSQTRTMNKNKVDMTTASVHTGLTGAVGKHQWFWTICHRFVQMLYII